MNATQQRLAGEITDLSTQLNKLADLPTDNATEAEHRSAEIARITEELSVRHKQYEVEEESEAARAKVAAVLASVNNSGLVVPQKRSSKPVEVEPIDDALPITLHGYKNHADAASAGRAFRSLYRGEVRELLLRAATPSTHSIGANTDIVADTMGESSPTFVGRGPELVTSELYRGILNLVQQQTVCLALAKIFQVSGDQMFLPILDDVDEASWVNEACEVPPILPHLSKASLALKKLAARIQVSNELMNDSSVAIGSLITYLFSRSFGKKLDKVYFGGDAGIGFAGVVPSIPAGNVVTAAAAAPTLKEISSVINKVDPLTGPRQWVVSDAFLATARELNTGAIGVSIADGMKPTIFGVPYRVSQYLPAKTLAVYGCFEEATAIGVQSNGMTIRSSYERAMEYDSFLAVAVQRVAFSAHTPKYLAALKTA